VVLAFNTVFGIVAGIVAGQVLGYVTAPVTQVPILTTTIPTTTKLDKQDQILITQARCEVYKTISKHINNALKEELTDEVVVAKFANTTWHITRGHTSRGDTV
jgi:hypothetical protein